MKNKPMVSVGIPCYNRPDSLRNTLEAIVNQTYDNLEIIISDNCSPDLNVEKIGKEYAKNDSRIKYYRQKKNQGATYNFQYVKEKATGDYFMWASDDDDYHTELVENLIEGFSISDKLVLVAGLSDNYENHDSLKSNFRYDGYSSLGKTQYERFKEISFHFITRDKRIEMLLYGIYKTECALKVNSKKFVGPDYLYLTEMSLLGEYYTVPKVLINKYGSGTSSAFQYAKQFDDKLGRINPAISLSYNIIKIALNESSFSGIEKLKITVWCIIFCIIRQGKYLRDYLQILMAN